jgi:hypothetical protein
MHPFYLSLPTNRIGQAIQAVADDAVDPLDASCSESFRKLIGDRFGHDSILSYRELLPLRSEIDRAAFSTPLGSLWGTAASRAFWKERSLWIRMARLDFPSPDNCQCLRETTYSF